MNLIAERKILNVLSPRFISPRFELHSRARSPAKRKKTHKSSCSKRPSILGLRLLSLRQKQNKLQPQRASSENKVQGFKPSRCVRQTGLSSCLTGDKRKQELGQFFSTQYEKILQNLSIPLTTKHIIEPFVGQGDLLSFIEKDYDGILEIYDIDLKVFSFSQGFMQSRSHRAHLFERCSKFSAEQKDTLLNPPSYENKFVITNPPYFARNKSKDKQIYNLYKTNDLYKCFLKTLVISKPVGGILIIPLNFFSSLRETDIEIRNAFLSVFQIVHLNIFEERMFKDTSSTICSFQFLLTPEKK
jgi:hypothetical protein